MERTKEAFVMSPQSSLAKDTAVSLLTDTDVPGTDGTCFILSADRLIEAHGHAMLSAWNARSSPKMVVVVDPLLEDDQKNQKSGLRIALMAWEEAQSTFKASCSSRERDFADGFVPIVIRFRIGKEAVMAFPTGIKAPFP